MLSGIAADGLGEERESVAVIFFFWVVRGSTRQSSGSGDVCVGPSVNREPHRWCRQVCEITAIKLDDQSNNARFRNGNIHTRHLIGGIWKAQLEQAFASERTAMLVSWLRGVVKRNRISEFVVMAN